MKLSAEDIYAMPTKESSEGLSFLNGCYYSHIPEVDFYSVREDFNERVEIRDIKDVDFDGRRIWRLSTVWFDGKPVMIVQNAGREGDDHARRFITNLPLYAEMVGYLASLQKPDIDGKDVIDPTEKRNDLDDFYNCSLDTVDANQFKWYGGR